MTFWQQAIDIYCERKAPGLWNEPWNAVSNFGFFAAGIWGLRAWMRQRGDGPSDRRPRDRGSNNSWLLVGSICVLLTAIGSVLFHTFANQWSHLADLIPILLFMLTAVSFSFREVLGLSRVSTSVGVAVFMALTLWIEFGPLQGLANGSAVYFPTLLLLGALGWGLRSRRTLVGKFHRAASIVFAISLTARALDAASCTIFAHGTHFIWHLLNGTLLAILLHAMSVQGRLALRTSKRR